MVDLNALGLKKLKSLKGIWTEIPVEFEKGNVLFSTGSLGGCYLLTEDMKKQVEKIELISKCKVIHVISGKYKFSNDDIFEMEHYVIVTSEDAEIETEIIQGSYELFNYMVNKSCDEGEFGYSVFKPSIAGGLKRVA